MQKLNLINPLTFKRVEISFNELMLKMLLSPKGSDSFILYSYAFDDSGCKFTRVDSGMKSPLTKEEKERIERGLSPIVRDDDNTSIPAGSYLFEQYPDLSEEELLATTFAAITAAKGDSNLLYVRLYKENELECVMQAFRPCSH